MVEQLMSFPEDAAGQAQLIARAGHMNSRGALLDDAINDTVLRGCLVFAADAEPTTVWARATTGTLPAGTDIIGILTDDITLVTAAGDVKCNVYTQGEFNEDVVWAASAALDAAAKVAVRESCLKQGINLVKSLYGQSVNSATRA
jgi:hypothetical protein